MSCFNKLSMTIPIRHPAPLSRHLAPFSVTLSLSKGDFLSKYYSKELFKSFDFMRARVV